MKNPPTDIVKQYTARKYIHMTDGVHIYAVPKKTIKEYCVSEVLARGNIPAKEFFAELDERFTKAGALLKGARHRENMTQKQFAKKLGVSQPNLSAMENGKRAIGKNIAKRIEKLFGINYRYFLE